MDFFTNTTDAFTYTNFARAVEDYDGFIIEKSMVKLPYDLSECDEQNGTLEYETPEGEVLVATMVAGEWIWEEIEDEGEDMIQKIHYIKVQSDIAEAATEYWINYNYKNAVEWGDGDGEEGRRFNINHTDTCGGCGKKLPCESIITTSIFEGGISGDICEECWAKLLTRFHGVVTRD